MPNPIAVLISDIHYNINTLEVADVCLRYAIDYANSIRKPLIVAGDLHDTKAMLRAECVNALIETFKLSEESYVLVGNHDLINEKGSDNSLEFLNEYTNLISEPKQLWPNWNLLPYYHDTKELELVIKGIPKGSLIIMHQGVKGAYMGHYIQDKSSIDPALLEGYTVFSGHYHQRQEVKCGETGKMTYIGNPYTLSFAEANDPVKGFLVLMDDGSYEVVPTDQRSHIIAERTVENLYDPVYWYNLHSTIHDILWLKVSGDRVALDKLSKEDITDKLFAGDSNYKLEKIYPATIEINQEITKEMSNLDIMNGLIQQVEGSQELKVALTKLYKELLA